MWCFTPTPSGSQAALWLQQWLWMGPHGLGQHTGNFGSTFSFSHSFLCWSLEIRALPHFSLSSQGHVSPWGALALGQLKTEERASVERIRASVGTSLMRLISFFLFLGRIKALASLPGCRSQAPSRAVAPCRPRPRSMGTRWGTISWSSRSWNGSWCRYRVNAPVGCCALASLGGTGLTGMRKSSVSKHQEWLWNC